MGSILFSLALLIICLYFLLNSISLEDLRAVDPIGAAGIPTFILFFLVVLLTNSLIAEIVKYRKHSEQADDKPIINKATLKIAGLIVGIVIFILVLNKAGFLLSSLFLTPILLLILGAQGKIQIISFSLIIPIYFAFLFGNVLSIPLPKGIGLFFEISNFFY